ncbi:hypothetical protein TNCV_3179821 [Trichonephila clavipes]|nr:hypothetical protein TNCV_3179821 [Trichonephila clavipes]
MELHWCRQFSEGRQSVHDEERSGRPPLIFVDFVELPSNHTSSREVGGMEREVEALANPKGVHLHNWGVIEQNHTVTCMVLKSKVNDRAPRAKIPEFPAPWCRQDCPRYLVTSQR